jgi:hypothetical protein
VLAKVISNCYHNLTVKQSNLISLYFVEKGTYRCIITNVVDKGKLDKGKLEDAWHTEWTDRSNLEHSLRLKHLLEIKFKQQPNSPPHR